MTFALIDRHHEAGDFDFFVIELFHFRAEHDFKFPRRIVFRAGTEYATLARLADTDNQ